MNTDEQEGIVERELLIDENRGIYIPQEFSKRFDPNEWQLGNEKEALDILKAGPDHTDYWEAWDEILATATFVEKRNGQQLVWALEQEGSLFAVRYHDFK